MDPSLSLAADNYSFCPCIIPSLVGLDQLEWKEKEEEENRAARIKGCRYLLNLKPEKGEKEIPQFWKVD